LFLAQQHECLACAFGRALVGGGKLRRVQQLDAGRHFEAARAADHQQARHTGLLGGGHDRAEASHEIVQRVGLGVAAEGAKHCIVPAQRGGQRVGLVHVGLHDTQIGCDFELARIGDERGDEVAAREGFAAQRRSDEAAGADECDVHGRSFRCDAGMNRPHRGTVACIDKPQPSKLIGLKSLTMPP
jgi:hypothetical protein